MLFVLSCDFCWESKKSRDITINMSTIYLTKEVFYHLVVLTVAAILTYYGRVGDLSLKLGLAS